MKKWSLNTWLWLGLTIVFLTLLSLGQLQRWQLTPGIAIYGHDVVAILGLLLALWQQRLTLHRSWQTQPWAKWRLELVLVGWIGLGWLIAFIQHASVGVGILYTARLVVYALFTLAWLKNPIWHLLPSQWQDVKLPSLGYWLVGLATLYLGFLQYLFLPDTRSLGLIGWDNHYYRLIGPLLDPGFTGIILVITLLITTAFKTKNQMGLWLIKTLLVMGIALTYSRASYLALAAGLVSLAALTFWQRRKMVWETGLLLFLGLLIFVIPKPGGEGVNLARTSTITSRVTSSQENVSDLSFSQRLIGRGLFVPDKIESTNTLRPDFAKLPDNLFVLVFSNLGILGAGLILLWLIKHQTLWKKVPPFIQSLVVATLVHSQFNNTLFQPFIFLIVAGLVLSYLLPQPET